MSISSNCAPSVTRYFYPRRAYLFELQTDYNVVIKYLVLDSFGQMDGLPRLVAHDAQSQPDDCDNFSNADTEASQGFHGPARILSIAFSCNNNVTQGDPNMQQVI